MNEKCCTLKNISKLEKLCNFRKLIQEMFSMEINKYLFLEKLKKLDFIESIWLFGSRARIDNSKKSDIDLAIVCPNATIKDWFKVITIIENADTLLKIDCIRIDDKLDKDLRKNINRDKKIIYEQIRN
jgi:predicted nucleotidyltransferase